MFCQVKWTLEGLVGRHSLKLKSTDQAAVFDELGNVREWGCVVY